MSEDSAVARVKEVARELAKGVRPVFSSREGSSGLEHIGSCLLIEAGDVFAAVTARHVLESPQPKFFGVSVDGSERWPADYKIVESLKNTRQDPDLAVAVLGHRVRDRGYAAVPISSLAPAFTGPVGAQLLAVGYPVSKSRNKWRDDRIETGTQFATVQLADEQVYRHLDLDPNLQIAVSYSNEGRRSADGGPGMLAQPHGMSGGVLLFMAEEQTPNGMSGLKAFVVGVLTEFHNVAGGVLVATKLDAVIAALAPTLVALPSGLSLRDV